ncbi:MAG: 4'-phosphopantetheinyl transferase superfamily protein [Bacteroidales bacterium]|nr:4'-phosphopantetheinyl transferase superfamily protein [Bacteroidales bacterium]
MPLLTQNINIEDVEVGFWRTDETADQLYAMAVDMISADEKSVYQSFKNDRRRREWLATRLLIKEMLGRYPGISYDGFGAPILSGCCDINISVSHTDGLVAVSLSYKCSVGIDIERITNRVLRIKHKFLNPDEYNTDDPNLLQLLYIQWCAKEAMYKALNVEHYDYQNTYTLPGFHFDGVFPGIAQGKVIADDDARKYLTVNYFEVDGCVCCVAR